MTFKFLTLVLFASVFSPMAMAASLSGEFNRVSCQDVRRDASGAIDWDKGVFEYSQRSIVRLTESAEGLTYQHLGTNWPISGLQHWGSEDALFAPPSDGHLYQAGDLINRPDIAILEGIYGITKDNFFETSLIAERKIGSFNTDRSVFNQKTWSYDHRLSDAQGIFAAEVPQELASLHRFFGSEMTAKTQGENVIIENVSYFGSGSWTETCLFERRN